MTDTEALEVKEMAVTEEASEDTRVQATVGDNEVAALVDEAQYEVKNVEDEASQEKKVEVADNNQVENKTTEVGCKPGEEQEKPCVAAAPLMENHEIQTEKPEEGSQTLHSEDLASNWSSAPETSQNPRRSQDCEVDLQQEVISNAHTEEEQQSHSNYSDKESKGSITKVDENENLNDNVETIPSTTETLSDNNETITQSTVEANLITASTHSVLPGSEDNNHEEPAQIHIPEQEDEAQMETNNPSMNDSFTDLQETLIAQTSGPSNVLKSVVDTTIGPRPRTSITGPLPNGSQGLPMLVKPPKTDDLLATAKEVLQLRDEPANVIIGEF